MLNTEEQTRYIETMRYSFENESYLCREAGIQRSTDYCLDYVGCVVKAREYEASNREAQCRF